MNTPLPPGSAARSEAQPVFWYGIPHGYAKLDLDPPRERIEALVQDLNTLPVEQRAQASQVLQFYAGMVTTLNKQNVHMFAVGYHPDDDGTVVTSTLSISTVPASGHNAKLVIAGLAGSAADDPETGLRPLELPCGLGYLAEEKKRTVAVGGDSHTPEAPARGDVWQGTVAVTGSGTPDIIVVQMVTPALHLADVYRDILLGVAHTLTFTDPAEPAVLAESEPSTRSAAAAIRNDFG
ncbi:hypothetical protein [Streptomyces luteolus]|uniref:Uncharacterized protein n=1 Tax=Streptomyces luteolus TaxID=3043615 RepID=A0ABT6SW30_9ACTN|nr:hypothetical protein [Streptomyces sp. B-S-A12]MDI3419796.1 hypothetical protein [Streptomyces sp. B-S-A12]